VRRWVHQEAGKAGALLQRLDRACKTLVTVACLDEIFFRRQPVLVAVEPQSMAWVLSQRACDRSGPTWAAALRDWPALRAVVADGGTGLHAGLSLVQQQRQQSAQAPLEVGLDVFHTQREAQRLLRTIWSRTEGLWIKAEAAGRQVSQDKQQGQGAQSAAARARWAWKRAIEAFDQAEAVEAAWQEITAALQVFHPDGRLNTLLMVDDRCSSIASAYPARVNSADQHRARDRCTGVDHGLPHHRVHGRGRLLPEDRRAPPPRRLGLPSLPESRRVSRPPPHS
jgi:hypothetical protein